MEKIPELEVQDVYSFVHGSSRGTDFSSDVRLCAPALAIVALRLCFYLGRERADLELGILLRLGQETHGDTLRAVEAPVGYKYSTETQRGPRIASGDRLEAAS